MSITSTRQDRLTYQVFYRRALVQTEIQPSAVLDLHFQLSSAKQNICAAVSSTASLAIFSFSPETGTQKPLSLLRTVRIPTVGEEILFLSFAWHPYMQDVVAVTTSTGQVQLLRLGAGYDTCAMTSDPVLTHSLETWCVAFIQSVELRPPQGSNGDEEHEQPFTLLSGGDDSTLRYAACMMRPALDATELNLTVEIPYPVAKMGGHDAGVTAILPLELTTGTSELVVTGSYDDHIRLFAIEPLQNSNGIRRTRKLAEQNLGGGVWRLKLIDTTTSVDGWRATILASCMHAGTRIVEITSKSADDYYFEVLGRFEEHKSMNYGSDVQPGKADTLRCISTSFYDKLLCLWEFRAST